MRPAAAPPPLEPRRRRPLVAVAVAAGLALVLVGAGVATAAVRSRNDARDRRVASLVRVKPAGTLVLAVSRDGLTVTNASHRKIKWQATQ